MGIEKVEPVSFDNIYKILSSTRISDKTKQQYIENHKLEIKNVMLQNITSVEFKEILGKRALQKFRPLKNSFTKQGDKMLLAKALEIPIYEIPKYIKNVTVALKQIDGLKFLPKDKLEMLKTYIYRHGSKDELVLFLDYELSKANNIVNTLYKTLEYHNHGIADYFIRPIHRLDNKTLIKIYKIINKHIKQSYKLGKTSDIESEKIAKWALIQLYKIQNNSQFINAIKTYNSLSSC